MDLAFIDHMAANGDTPLHQVRAGIKLAASGLLIAATIVASTPPAAATATAAVVGLAVATRQPLRRLAGIAVYPVLFAGLFALGWARSDLAFAAVIVIRAFNSGLIAALLMATTTFVDVFAVLTRALPGSVADGLFMAYRAFFLLFDELGRVLQAIRLRGGAGPTWGAQLRTYGEAMAVIVIHAADMTERMYRMMTVRGYSGRIQSARAPHPTEAMHYALLAYAAAVLAFQVVLRQRS